MWHHTGEHLTPPLAALAAQASSAPPTVEFALDPSSNHISVSFSEPVFHVVGGVLPTAADLAPTLDDAPLTGGSSIASPVLLPLPGSERLYRFEPRIASPATGGQQGRT